MTSRTRGRVEVARRLVGQNEARLHRERAGDRHPLLLPAREVDRQPPGKRGETELLEEQRRSLPPLAEIMREPHRQQDVLPGAELRHELEGLEDESDRVAAKAREPGLREAGERCAGDDDAPGRRAVEAAEQVEQRRLARSGRANDRHELPRLDLQIDVVKHRARRLPAPVHARQPDRRRKRWPSARLAQDCSRRRGHCQRVSHRS